MNLNAAAQLLFHHFPPEERSIPDATEYPGRNAAVAAAMNAALQEICLEIGDWARRDSRGDLIHAPATVMISVTNGSTSATIQEAEWKSWFSGCTIRLGEIDNQIRNNSRNVVLKVPYSGQTGTVAATIYQDAVTLSSDVVSVIEPIRCNGRLLHPMESPHGNISTPVIPDYGRRYYATEPLHEPLSVSDAASQPVGYYVETWPSSANLSASIRLRLSPAASADGHIEYECLTVPLVVEDLESTVELPIPAAFVASTFLPIAKFHLQSSPFSRAIDDPSKIDVGYQEAMKKLRKCKPYRTDRTRFVTKG